ncbi:MULTISPECIES: DUF202 domain-containing protein [Mycobacterium]|uniref:DUF202 domain-containing protein n=1 Tax=Mycobacterium syngnathidarum TaxID=1908205 RepID=A0A1S1JT08_9MYCO|nr:MULTISPECIES: DUF202 domain-containing protein [Mycobacterium]MCG7607987.1 DUF202 domain-containing protein [Mycobacterium sp. CnD-18-1]OHT90621.1 hypothetical protein BKG61_27255 [Mycobacterium syngnathidarum]
MTRQALAEDRGLQAERTSLAWTRTALAVATSGVLVLLRDGRTVGLGHDPVRITVVIAAVVLAAGVYAVGLQRRRQLLARPRDCAAAGRRYLPGIGIAVIIAALLVVTYLALSAAP